MIESLDTKALLVDGAVQNDPGEGGTVHPGCVSMSYRTVADGSAAVAAALAELNVRAGERVLIMLPDSPGFVDAFIGAIRQGAVPLPVNPLLEMPDITTVAAETGARLVVASAERIRALATLGAGAFTLLEGPHELGAASLQLS
ncbi:MAG: AMP-binding protein [Pseudonocardiaceae bacterium]